MIKNVAHIGITVTKLTEAIKFYRDILGLKYIGQMRMEGESTDNLFARKGVRANVAYLNGSDDLIAPPIELIEFEGENIKKKKESLFSSCVSEICFYCEDILSSYERLSSLGVEFLSAPQTFDSTSYGLGKSIAVYFYDMDGNILELIQAID